MLIGLNGLKGSGKDTVGSYLVDRYGFEQLSFAAKLKESAAALFDVPMEVWEQTKNDPQARVILHTGSSYFDNPAITVREFLQRYGTEAHRSVFGSDFWVDQAMEGIDPNKNYIFTDARFENELQRIKSLGGYNVQILRPELTNEDSHASEVPPPKELIDYALVNGSDFDALYTQVDEFMEWLGIKGRFAYETN